MEPWTDISDGFVVLENELVFVNEPLEGFLRSKDSGALFAFRSIEIVPELLWHWFLIPTTSTADSVTHTFTAAGSTPPARWMSIIEDRRRGQPKLSLEWIT